MATEAYITGRRRYQRPQAVLWSNNPGTLLESGLYVPTGYEIGADPGNESDTSLLDQFLILSDHNRSEIKIAPKRIEQRRRTINGRMRSYHIADKLDISWSWNNLPSRSGNTNPMFDSDGKPITSFTRGLTQVDYQENTADGGAGGVEILDWYENHKGSFWMFLAYDKYSNFSKDDEGYTKLGQYNQVIEVFFNDFNYDVVKRGGSNFDLWNISVSLEEA